MSRLDEIRARVAKATPGPWESGRLLKDYDGDYMVWHGRDDEGQRQYVGSVGGLIEPVVPVGADILFEAERDNAEYIAHARADLPALLAVAEAATAYRETDAVRAELLPPPTGSLGAMVEGAPDAAGPAHAGYVAVEGRAARAAD